MRGLFVFASLMVCSIVPSLARADEASGSVPEAEASTGAGSVYDPLGMSSSLRSPDLMVRRAREMLVRAKFLDETATSDERLAADLLLRMPTLRKSASSAREKADHATASDLEALAQRADELEADLAVSEAEVTVKKRLAADNRRMARELRVRAVGLVREATAAVQVRSPVAVRADGIRSDIF
ncbi:hypothetical protein AKJ09_05241 [Labilithrix luteola]|uniref:DUF4398 domain-containing protein n=1 Tax=Labilithrix luteola TaxID=1391654 RepID=A0A0K1PYJ7_9BACT|nr:hypothetical protein [Labilithrix luteola]AKU98577.1 hypothetical protein AKJ09_05241 [Labilithrix luteola]